MFKWLCGRHQQKTKSIAVGDLYGLIDKSPWSKGNVVTILDVKDGWVRYYMNPFFCNERMEVFIFNTIYKKVG